MISPRFLSLCSGCGGFESGFLEAGFECVASVDIDSVACDTLKLNADHRVINSDLRGFLSARPSFERLDVLVAGAPCQGFSTIGKNRSDDPRNAVLASAIDAVEIYRPPVVVLENVPALTNGRHRETFEAVRFRLWALGYRVAWRIINAHDHGVPQLRKRLVVIGWSRNHHSIVEPVGTKGGTLRDAIGNLKDQRDHDPLPLDPVSRLGRIANAIKSGQKLSNVRNSEVSVHTWDLPEIFGFVSHREQAVLQAILSLRRRKRMRSWGDADPVLSSDVKKDVGFDPCPSIKKLIKKNYLRKQGARIDLTYAFNGKFRRLSWEKPSRTVDTRFGDPTLFLHPSENRGFTVREAARIQGFSDKFRFAGSRSDRFRMIGNAVPPPVARSIAEMLRSQLLK